MLSQTDPEEPVQEGVREDHEMEIGPVRLPVTGRDLPQGVGFLHLADDQFGFRPVVVKLPEGKRGKGQIGEHLGGEPAELEQVELPGRFLGDKPADDHEAAGPLGLVPELGGGHGAGPPRVSVPPGPASSCAPRLHAHLGSSPPRPGDRRHAVAGPLAGHRRQVAAGLRVFRQGSIRHSHNCLEPIRRVYSEDSK